MIQFSQVYDKCEVYHMGELRLSIPTELHKELKQRALDKGVSLKQLILDIFENYTGKRKTETGKINKEG